MLKESVMPKKKKKEEAKKKGPSAVVMMWEVAKMGTQGTSWDAPPSWGVLPCVVGFAKEECCHGFSKESSGLEGQIFNGDYVLVPLTEVGISHS